MQGGTGGVGGHRQGVSVRGPMGVAGAAVPARGVPQGGWPDHRAGRGDEAGMRPVALWPAMDTPAADCSRPWGQGRRRIASGHGDESSGRSRPAMRTRPAADRDRPWVQGGCRIATGYGQGRRRITVGHDDEEDEASGRLWLTMGMRRAPDCNQPWTRPAADHGWP